MMPENFGNILQEWVKESRPKVFCLTGQVGKNWFNHFPHVENYGVVPFFSWVLQFDRRFGLIREEV
jgi:hypothetical protein